MILHHHLAKLHLHSHVFRGLKGASVPPYFQESAVAAVTAATAVVEMLLTDHDVTEALNGIPHYIHSMIAFACVFLLRVAAQHPGQYIDDARVLAMTGQVVQQLRSTLVSKYHLVHLMADGLEKMASSDIRSSSAMHHSFASGDVPPPSLQYVADASAVPPVSDGIGGATYTNSMNDAFDEDFILGTTPFLHFESGTTDYNLGGFSKW